MATMAPMGGLASATDRPGTYRLRSADGADTPSAYVDLRVGPDWAALLAVPADLPASAPVVARLLSAGFTPPRRRARSPATRSWFQSWSWRTLDERTATAAAIAAAARQALHLPADASLEAERRPDGEGDPRIPITIVLGTVFLAYSVVAGWIVLVAWDYLLPSRAHPASAIWAQVVAPIAAFLLFAGYVSVLPKLRLARAARRRPPTAAEVDLTMPAISTVGLALSPLVLSVLLLGTSGW